MKLFIRECIWLGLFRLNCGCLFSMVMVVKILFFGWVVCNVNYLFNINVLWYYWVLKCVIKVLKIWVYCVVLSVLREFVMLLVLLNWEIMMCLNLGNFVKWVKIIFL